MSGRLKELYPDPALAANLYLSNRLDDLVYFVIRPFWSSFRTHDPGEQYYLWLFRYGRCGEHLKIRVHGPPAAVPLLRELLGELSNDYFAHSAPFLPSQKGSKGAPPIDREDDSPEDYQDRTFLWTHYERSIVSLGANPLLADDTYVALFTRCLGMACEFLLSRLNPSALPSQGGFPHRFRQATLLKLILTALTVVGFTPEERIAYLNYHRDWLIRGLWAQKQPAWPSERDILERLESGTDRLEGGKGVIKTLAASRWEASVAETDARLVSWQRAVADLSRYVAFQRREPGDLLDPFAENPVFPSIFKALHVAANQIGLKKMDEAFAYHLLLRSIMGDKFEIGMVRRVPFVNAPVKTLGDVE